MPKRSENAYPHSAHTLSGVLRWKLGFAAPRKPPSFLHPLPEGAACGGSDLLPSGTGPIRLTWIGHSTFLIQHQGRNVLTDPIFGHCGPLPIGGLRRLTRPGISLHDLPEIHEVLISHSHYDHLDAPTIRTLGNTVRYWLPSGLSGWFRKRGISSCRELAWWEPAAMSPTITISSVPAQHASGRTPFDRDATHWCGWVLQSAERSIYFAGDTGYSPSFREIGRTFRGFDLAMIPVGAYAPEWLMQPMHLNPAEAVQAHLDVSSRLSVACHWGTFRMTDEALSEPPQLLTEELRVRQVDPGQFRVLRPGDTLEI